MSFSSGHRFDRVTYSPHMGINRAIIKAQIARMLPNIFSLPSVFCEVRSTKYPTTTQKVAGKKLNIKHTASSS